MPDDELLHDTESEGSDHGESTEDASDERPSNAGRPAGSSNRPAKVRLFNAIEKHAGSYFKVVDTYIRNGQEKDLKDRSKTAMDLLQLRFGKAPTRRDDEEDNKKPKLNSRLMTVAELRQLHGRKKEDDVE